MLLIVPSSWRRTTLPHLHLSSCRSRSSSPTRWSARWASPLEMIAARPRPRSSWRGRRDPLGRDGRRHVVRHRLHLGAWLSSAELDSTATVVIELSRHLFCLLSVGLPSLVCIPPARARLVHALPSAVRLSVSPHVPFGAAQRQIFPVIPGLGTSPGPCISAFYFAGPCTLALYFCRGRDLGGLLRSCDSGCCACR